MGFLLLEAILTLAVPTTAQASLLLKLFDQKISAYNAVSPRVN
jgi:hypothetical protein